MQRDKLKNRQADRQRYSQTVTQSERHDREADRHTWRRAKKRRLTGTKNRSRHAIYRKTDRLVHRDRQERKSDRQSRDRQNDKHTARRERDPHTRIQTSRQRQSDRDKQRHR